MSLTCKRIKMNQQENPSSAIFYMNLDTVGIFFLKLISFSFRPTISSMDLHFFDFIK